MGSEEDGFEVFGDAMESIEESIFIYFFETELCVTILDTLAIETQLTGELLTDTKGNKCRRTSWSSPNDSHRGSSSTSPLSS